jgi:site-specific recombinase XerD
MRSQWTGFHSVLGDDIRRFVDYKRALGRRYDNEEKALRGFDSYLVAQEVEDLSEVTPELIDRFLASRHRPRPRSYNLLLCTVRRLFDWMRDQGRVTDSPVRARSRRETSQRVPFIFDLPTARRLLEAARRLPDKPRALNRGTTYYTIFAILYGLGLRVGEVCRLRIGDADLERGLLVIRGTKFNKNRLVPFGPRMRAAIQKYLDSRGPMSSFASDAPAFSFTNGREIHPCTVSATFHTLIPRLGLQIPTGISPPRLHDLRHSFAVGTLLRWYRDGIDPGAGLLALATFLGHVDVTSTATYLTMTESLLREANRRFEAFAEPVLQEGERQ